MTEKSRPKLLGQAKAPKADDGSAEIARRELEQKHRVRRHPRGWEQVLKRCNCNMMFWPTFGHIFTKL